MQECLKLPRKAASRQTGVRRVNRCFLRWFFFLGLLLLPTFSYAKEGAVSSVSGKVVLVKVMTNQVLLAYRRPGDFVETISTFKIDEKTQFKNVGGLAALKINDPVTVLYAEPEAGVLQAQVVEKG